jgi:predicted metal-dependent peptidase
MRSKPFGLLRGVMMLGKTTFTDEIPTACTNGRDEKYNLDFWFETVSNTRKGLGFGQVHENFHKVAKHMIVYQTLYKEDPMLANMACDYWINGRIIKADPNGLIVEMPRDKEGKNIGLHDTKYDGWTVKRIFNHLKQEQEKGGDDGEGEGTGGGGGFDSHDWEGAEELTKEERKELGDKIDEAVRQGIHVGQKAGGGSLADALGLKDLITPKVDWRIHLRTFMNATCQRKEQSSWRRPNRRFLHQDIIMPTLEGRSIRELLVARDASGSMYWEDRMTKVTSEMLGIAKLLDIEKIHVLDWDGEVAEGGHTTYSSRELESAPELKTVRGGGGTNPSCVSRYIDEVQLKPDCIIMLTDGEIYNWGSWRHPILWAITNDDTITAPVGKTINID